MTPRDFCYWLQGFIELSKGDIGITPEQVIMIKQHLDLCFKNESKSISVSESGGAVGGKLTPPYGIATC